MPSTQLKDYYKILELNDTATDEEVKKAYRKLAKQYHPDTNIDSTQPDSLFHDIQEAYNVLSNIAARQRYDQERWLSGMAKRAAEQQAVTPQWILQESIKLQTHMSSIDVYRMSHYALRTYVTELLDDDNIKLLQEESEPSINESIVLMILESTKLLKYYDMLVVAERLELISDNSTQLMINVKLAQRKRDWKRAKQLPYIIIFITFIITVCMFLWARK